MEVNKHIFIQEALQCVKALEDSQKPHVLKACQLLCDCLECDGVIHVFGSGHSHGFGNELMGRLGSLVPVHRMSNSDFILYGKYTLQEMKDPNNIFERRPGVAKELYDLYNIQPQDCFIIISNSGINGLVIDMAALAKESGHKVIVITSMQHTLAEESRHPSGKKLYELGDVVIDNCGPYGDALLETDGIEKVSSISSITGAILGQLLVTLIAMHFGEKGKKAPLLSNDICEDKSLFDRYGGRI